MVYTSSNENDAGGDRSKRHSRTYLEPRRDPPIEAHSALAVGGDRPTGHARVIVIVAAAEVGVLKRSSAGRLHESSLDVVDLGLRVRHYHPHDRHEACGDDKDSRPVAVVALEVQVKKEGLKNHCIATRGPQRPRTTKARMSHAHHGQLPPSAHRKKG